MEVPHSDFDGGERILLVDAAPDEREMYAVALRAHGFDVRESGDGEEALIETRIAAPDLVVADAVLPRVDGLQLLAALQSDVVTRDIPVIILTEYDQPLHVITEAKAAGATTVRIKPCLPAALIKDIEHIFQRCIAARERGQTILRRSQEVRAKMAAVLGGSTDVTERPCPACGATLKPSGVVRVSVGHTYYRPCPNGCGWWYYDARALQMMKLN